MSTSPICPFKVGDIVRFNPEKAGGYTDDCHYELKVERLELGYSRDGREWMIWYYSPTDLRERGAYVWRFFTTTEDSTCSPLERKIRRLWDRQNYVKKGLHHATV